MNVWGIGANWKKEGDSTITDVTCEFITNGVAAIGWTEEQAPSLYAMAEEIQQGDIIYLKSYLIKGSRLKIKAIGEVVDTVYIGRIYEGHKVFKVNWFSVAESIIELTVSEKINNVFRNTLYREYNPRIIDFVTDKNGGKTL